MRTSPTGAIGMSKVWNVFHRPCRWRVRKPCRWLPMGKCFYRLLTQSTVYVMCSRPFRGVYVSEYWSRDHGTIRPSETLVKRLGDPKVKPVKIRDKAAIIALANQDSKYFAEHPHLIDFLSKLQYEDGTPRQAGYLGVWTNGTAWTVRVTDKDADAQMTFDGRTLDEALDTLELHLGSENPPWEPCSRRKKKSG